MNTRTFLYFSAVFAPLLLSCEKETYPQPSISIGDFHEDGVVFFVDESGQQNMMEVLASCSEPNSAAALCKQLEMNGYNDWFLPIITIRITQYGFNILMQGRNIQN